MRVERSSPTIHVPTSSSTSLPTIQRRPQLNMPHHRLISHVCGASRKAVARINSNTFSMDTYGVHLLQVNTSNAQTMCATASSQSKVDHTLMKRCARDEGGAEVLLQPAMQGLHSGRQKRGAMNSSWASRGWAGEPYLLRREKHSFRRLPSPAAGRCALHHASTLRTSLRLRHAPGICIAEGESLR